MNYPRRTKRWRRIVVDGVTYRWAPSEPALEILGPVSGCLPLRVVRGGDRIFLPRDVAEIIHRALAEGWNPLQRAGEPYHLRVPLGPPGPLDGAGHGGDTGTGC